MKIIITGASGMVGEGILLECLNTQDVTEVLVVGRKPCGHQHPKLRELLHQDFMNLEGIEKEITGYDACFFGLGVSSVLMDPDLYKKITYDLTLEMARRLARVSPELTFCYVTGRHTDSTEKGPVRWARVKGATENELLRLFKFAYMFRPGAMLALPGQHNIKPFYKIFLPTLPFLKAVNPGWVCSLQDVARAMLSCARTHPTNHILEIEDIQKLAKWV